MEIVVNFRARTLRIPSSGVATKVDQSTVWFILGQTYILILLAFCLSINDIKMMLMRVPLIGNAVMVLGITMRYSAKRQWGR